MKVGYVSLNVSDLDKSLDFYESVLGFSTVARPEKERAVLSVNDDGSYLIELLQADGSAKKDNDSNSVPITKRAGLYHFAILLPERKYLADVLQNLVNKRDQVYFDGLADHNVSESIYIRDPDFNGIEIYRDRPVSEWKWSGDRIQMATLPLDTKDLLRESTEKGWKGMPSKTTMGHVHLHVRDLAASTRFYRDILGLNMTAAIPGAAFYAAGKYHHHIAVNTWLGTDISPASPQSTGLNHLSIEFSNREEFEQIVTRLENGYNLLAGQTGNSTSKSFFLCDPDGISIELHN